MAEGTTLERLQVIIEAKAEAYKKEIDAVKAKTEKVTAAVNKCTERIHDAVNKVTAGPAGKEIDALTNKLNRQTEAINAQAAKVENLKNKLDALGSGEARNSSVSFLETELKKAEKALAAVDKQMQPLVDRLTEMETLQPKGNGEGYLKEIDTLMSQLRPLEKEYEGLLENAQQLKEQLREAQLNPNSTAQIRELKEQLRQTGKEIGIVKSQMDPLKRRSSEIGSLYATERSGVMPHEAEIKGIKSQLEQLTPDYLKLDAVVDELKRKLEEARMNPESTAEVQKLTSELELAAQKLDRLRGEAAQTQERLEKAGSGGASGMERFQKAMSGASAVMDKVKGKIAGVTAALHKHKSASDGCRFSADKLSKSIFKLGNMFKLMLIREIMRNTIEGAKKGFENLSQYSDSTNQSLTLLHSSLIQLQNAFAVAAAPILNAFAPALNQIVQMAIAAANAIGQLFAALTGHGTFIKAVGVTEDFASSLDKTGNAAKKAGKDIKNTTLGIDELNVIQQKQNSGGGLSPSDMFETVEVEGKYKDLAKKIKDIMSKLFRPFKEAWNREGKFVMDSWKYALNEVRKLFGDIGNDFLEVWNQEKTIDMLSDVLHIIGDIGLIVGNLARNFREAWNENQTGLHILENIRDIFAIIIQHVRNAADATVEWADKLDFSPLLTAFESFTESVKPVVDTISGIFEDFYTQVLLPLGKWTMEKGLPELLDILTEFNEKVDWGKIRDNLSDFWEKLEPFAETVGEGLLLFIEDCSNLVANFTDSEALNNFLDKLADWMENITPEDVADGIETLAGALIALKLAMMGLDAALAASAIVSALKNIGSAFVFLKEKVLLVVEFFKGFNFFAIFQTMNPGMMGELGFRIEDLLEGTIFDPRSWDGLAGEIYDSIDKFMTGLVDWIGAGILNVFEAIGTILTNTFNWDATLAIFEDAKENFKKGGLNIVLGILEGIVGAIGFIVEPIGDFFMGIWNAICDVFGIHSPADSMKPIGENIFLGIIEGFTSMFDGFTESMEIWWTDYVEPWFTIEKWTELYENIRLALEEKWNELTEWWNNSAIVVWWDEHVAPWFTIEKWSGILQNIKTSFKTKWDETVVQWKTGIDAWWKQHVQPWFTKEKWQKLGENLKNGVYEGFKGLANKVVDVLNGVISSLEGMINSAIKGINDLLAKVNQTALGDKLGWDFQIGNVSFGRIPQFAAGGFPAVGSLFIANEAGPELVGTMGGRTAVAPESSITQGIEEAAYQGMKRALSEESIGGMLIQLIDVVKEGKIIEADGREIAAVVNDRNARNGIVFT